MKPNRVGKGDYDSLYEGVSLYQLFCVLLYVDIHFVFYMNDGHPENIRFTHRDSYSRMNPLLTVCSWLIFL